MSIRFVLALIALATAAACASIPDVTFNDGDAAVDGGGTSGSGSSDATIADGAGGRDAATTTTDSGKDGSVTSTPDAATCGGSAGDICCGTQICHNCVPSDCPSCAGLACVAGKVCCAKTMSVTCHAPGPGC